jgi:hypothetical protein
MCSPHQQYDDKYGSKLTALHRRHSSRNTRQGITMSAVGSVGSSDSSSLLYLLYLQNSNAVGSAGNTTGAAATTDTGDSSASSTSSTSDLADLRSQIETAVTNAINNVSDSSDPSDVFKSVHDAIQSTLEANGVNPQQARGHGHHGHHHHASVGQSQSSTSESDPTETDPFATDPNVDPTSGTDAIAQTGQGGSNQDLLSILFQIGGQSSQPISGNSTPTSGVQSNQPTNLAGVLSASNANGNGGLDLNTLFGQLFANFPAGSGLNVLA